MISRSWIPGRLFSETSYARCGRWWRHTHTFLSLSLSLFLSLCVFTYIYCVIIVHVFGQVLVAREGGGGQAELAGIAGLMLEYL